MKKLWTLRELCDFMQWSEATARRRIAEARSGVGTLPLPVPSQKGEKLLFDPEAIARWAEARQETPQPTAPVSSSKQDKDMKRRLKLAYAALERHKHPKQEKLK